MLTVDGGSSIESTLFTNFHVKFQLSVLPLLSPISDYSTSCQVRALTGLIQPKRSSPKIQNDTCAPNFKDNRIFVPQISKEKLI